MEQDDRKGASFAAGDVLVCLGSPWFNTGYASLIRATRNRYGVRFAVLVYDIIPVRRPEWCDHALVRAFRRWLDGVLPLSDAIFSISRASAVDLERYAQEQGIALKGPVRALPIGSGFTDLHPAAARAPAANPVKGDYALIVSTIEARKNHALLFRVWRRLVEELPAEKVPTLVFAGRTGWLVADLMQQLKNADYLGGKVQLVDNPSDAELNQLYAGCLFTLFPSLYEGWGLPVTESLMAGKPCLLSNRTSLPEAGGDLARYFDPENVEDAYQVVRATIEDRPGLAAWQDEVRARFQPVAWSSSAEVVLEGLDALSSRVEA
jgi:glycosyltransferase involved in cell wall biosynthesis